MREFDNADRVPPRKNASAPPDHVLDIAKWPEEEPEEEQVWDIAGWNETARAEPSSRPIRADRKEPEQTTIPNWDQSSPGEVPPRFASAEIDDDEAGNRTAKIVGGIVVGLLLIGGAIYAYQLSSANSLAMKPAAQSNAVPSAQGNMVPPVQQKSPAALPAQGSMPAMPPAASLAPPAPAATAGPSQTTPGPIPPALRRAANNPVPRQPAVPAASDPINAPMTLTPETAPPPQDAAPIGRTVLQQPAAQASPPAAARDPIEAPMTLTPQTAPLPQQ